MSCCQEPIQAYECGVNRSNATILPDNRQRKGEYEKLFAGFLAVMMLCLTLGSAMASTNFSWSGNDTVNFHAWGSPDWSSGRNWHITWGDTNISSSLRAAVRIYAAPGEYASSIFVYSTESSAYHPYKSGYGNGAKKTYIAGRVDNRDSGTLVVDGTFYN